MFDKKTLVRPRDIIDASLSLLKLDTKLKKYLELDYLDGKELKPLEVIADLSKLPLLLKLMSVCPISDIGLESLLKKLRAKLIMSIDDNIISSDLFHLWEEHVPKHSRIYTDLIPIMEDVITRYMDDVKTRNYPGPAETIKMPEDELRKFAKDMKWERKLDELG